jgi:malonyl-CoA decarboxylase
VIRASFFSDLIETVTERGRRIMAGGPAVAGRENGLAQIVALAEALLSGRGEATGVARAAALLARYQSAGPDVRLAFLRHIAEAFGPDPQRLAQGIARYQASPGPEELAELHAAAEPRRQELIRRLNLAPGGTSALVAIRGEMLEHLAAFPVLKALDADFLHLFSSWFNRGFLVLRPIDWATPANILEKIIRYEAVHAIRDWNDLRGRLEPPDRRCFAFFHPALPDEPLVFVEVALTRDMPAAIAPLITSDRQILDPAMASVAVFYSISNCQKGLNGVSFGHFLIKQVVEDLRRVLPRLTSFVTLSPVPGFASWLSGQEPGRFPQWGMSYGQFQQFFGEPGWHTRPDARSGGEAFLLHAAAEYFLRAKNPGGRPVDPVARFHLGNGARLERMNMLGDVQAKGLHQSFGLMVNYRYNIDEIEENHEAYAEKGVINAAPSVIAQARTLTPSI